MGIFSRTRDIIATNLNDVLDRSEDPEKLIRQIIFEMNETLIEVRASAARVIADQKEMHRHVARLEELRDSWLEKAEVALSKNREDLATAALMEKQKASDMIAQMQEEIDTLDKILKAYEADIDNLQQKLHESRARQGHIANRLEKAENLTRLREMTRGDRVREALTSFEWLERHADAAEGRADALNLGVRRSLDEEFNALEVNNKISEELAALKAAHKQKSKQKKEG